MANYNKVILIGNLTRDPQLSYLPSQTAVVEVGLAINHKWKDQQGQQREQVCFVDCSAFGKQAETINQYCKKGNQIFIEGRLQYDSWEGKDGTKRSKHRVSIERFQFLGGPAGGGSSAPSGGGQRPQSAGPRSAQPQSQPQQADDFAEPMPPDMDEGGESIPF